MIMKEHGEPKGVLKLIYKNNFWMSNCKKLNNVLNNVFLL